MGLPEIICPRRAGSAVERRLNDLHRVRRSLDGDGPPLLPSEYAPRAALSRATRRRIRQLETVRDALGEIDRIALLRQLRPGPAPRWFVYDPLRACDSLRCTVAPTFAFEMCAGVKVVGRIRTDVPSLWTGLASFTAAPLLLPSPLRNEILALAARDLKPLVLFEPDRVRGPSGREHRLESAGDIGILVEDDGAWHLMTKS